MEEIIREIGLNEKEAKIYLELLKQKISTASKLAKITKINRTTAYLELENLMKLGLVNYVIKNSKRHYQPSPPEKLMEILEDKKRKIKSILPKLKLFQSPEKVIKIEIYEERGGLKTFYQDILNNAKEILAFGVTGLAFEILEFEFPHFIKKCMKKRIRARYLANENSKNKLSKLPKKFVKVKYLSNKYSAKVTTLIYEDKVAIQSLQKNKIYIVVIKDKNLYESYKHYFEFMWNLKQ